MPAGLQVYSSGGDVVVDLTTRLARVFGSINVAAGTGASVTDANFATGTPFALIIPLSTTVSGVGYATWSGNTMTVSTSDMATMVLYGVY